MSSTESLSDEAGAALLRFNEEAVLYCRGISHGGAQAYAMDYARMLGSRAKGLEFERTRFSTRLFAPDQRLIERTLDKMYRKFRATYRVASNITSAATGELKAMQEREHDTCEISSDRARQ